MKTLTLFLSVITVVACATPRDLEPKTGPGTDYPCGVHGVECGRGLCCDEGEACLAPTRTVAEAVCETVDGARSPARHNAGHGRD